MNLSNLSKRSLIPYAARGLHPKIRTVNKNPSCCRIRITTGGIPYVFGKDLVKNRYVAVFLVVQDNIINIFECEPSFVSLVGCMI